LVSDWSSDVCSSDLVVGGFVALELPGVQGQVGAQPVEGLLPQTHSLLVIELSGVLALAGGGQRRAAGGVVAEMGLPVVGQFGVGGEAGGVQGGRGVVWLLGRADDRRRQGVPVV